MVDLHDSVLLPCPGCGLSVTTPNLLLRHAGFQNNVNYQSTGNRHITVVFQRKVLLNLNIVTTFESSIKINNGDRSSANGLDVMDFTLIVAASEGLVVIVVVEDGHDDHHEEDADYDARQIVTYFDIFPPISLG